jgi:REP element-mobilizing transposase RayT
VTPQNWLFLGGYKTLRQRALEEYEWGCVARLGARAFETIGGEIVNVSLVSLSRLSPAKAHRFASIDVSEEKTPSEKDGALLKESLTVLTQSDQLRNPDARISAKEHDSEMSPLGDYTECYQGAVTGDLERFRVQFWEIRDTKKTWQPFRTTIDAPNTFDGLNASIKWQEGSGELHEYAAATRDQLHDMHESGNRAWNRLGVAINRMGDLFASAYLGEIFDNNVAVVIPKKKHDLPALLAFCSSPDFSDLVRSLDQTIKVTNRTLIKVPFDLAHWQKVAAEKYPHGLPEPESDDPTQWLFHGHPGGRVEAASRRLEGTRQDAASTFGFLDREAEIENLSGNLPHWRQEGVTYFVTFRTHDSIPQAKMQEWLAEREAWLKAHPEPHDAATRREYGRRFPGRFHEWLDAGYGACVLARPDCRAIVEGALRHFAGQRYALDEFVVMPNHVHVLVTPLAGHSLSAILHSWKSYTSKEIGKVLGKSGTFWQKESFDHILRSPEQLGKVRQYICGNPKGRVEAASRRLDQATQATRQDAASTLQVGVARLLAYRWPAELDEKMRLSKRARALVKQCDELLPFADADGIVCIPAVAGERTAADRLLALLSARGVKPDRNLDDWLRDKFFEEHCQLFHQRPFVWHIWDGRKKDGFHALVNYHQLDRKRLEKLIYTHLGDWIARQRAAESRSESGAEARHLAAEDLQERLKLILEGEPPYDIFVRWKPLEEQPIGWDPDVNDGVRINIRPFVTAGVLRKNPKIKWKKDRGKEPDRPKDQYPWFWGWDEETEDFMGGPEFDGNRWNDCHYSNEAKRAARAAKGKSKR